MKITFLISLFVLGCQSLPNTFEFKAPLPKGVVTSNMGGRWGRLHLGVDIGAPKWTVVRSTNDGVVVGISRLDKIFGNRIDIYHASVGLYSSYSHLQHISVQLSQKVKAGDLIGTVGSTGKSTGPHLHFEIYNSNGVFISPLGLINSHNFTYKYGHPK